MLRFAIFLAAISACTTTPPLEERLAEADARIVDCGAGATGYTITVTGIAVDLEYRPVAGVTIDLTTAWGTGPSFPTDGCRRGSTVTGADGRFETQITTPDYEPIVVALATKEGLAPTLADRRRSCFIGCNAVDITVVTVPVDVATAWREELYADGMEYALNLGLVAYRFVDTNGLGAAGVTPSWSDDSPGDAPSSIAPDRGVRFLETSTLLAAPGTRRTTSTGYALIGRPENDRGYYEVSGARDGSRWREVGVISATGWIYFESDDPELQ